MTLFPEALLGLAGSASTMYFCLRTGSTKQCHIREIGLTQTTTTAVATVGLARALNLATQSAFQPAVPHTSDTTFSLGSWEQGVASVWTTPTVFLRRATIPALIGAGVVWEFPYGEGLIVPVSNAILLWNITGTGATPQAWCCWEE